MNDNFKWGYILFFLNENFYDDVLTSTRLFATTPACNVADIFYNIATNLEDEAFSSPLGNQLTCDRILILIIILSNPKLL